MRRVGPLGATDDESGNGTTGDVSMEALRFPAWVPKLTEPTKQTADGTYLSLHDYNLLIARANTRNAGNVAIGVGVGLFIGWALAKAYRR